MYSRESFRFFAFACILFASLVLSAEELTLQTVFRGGTEGYDTYRIPSAITTKKGTILAFCEGRVNGKGDSGDIDLVLKRSADGGNTWGKLEIVWNDARNTCGNPCPLIDPVSGDVVLLLTHNLGVDSEHAIVSGKGKGSRTVWVMRSSDDGRTWSPPKDITPSTKLPDWTWYATGPGVSIVLKSGRWLVPCDHKTLNAAELRSHVIYSDDRGESWKIGGIVGPKANECQAAELTDGSVLLNMRTYRKEKLRLTAVSRDGGLTFSDPIADTNLIEPVCQASLLRDDRGGEKTLLFSNPASEKRERFTVRLSLDEGRTWPRELLLHAGPSAYSCLALSGETTIGCLYECGEKSAYEEIRWAGFSRGDLQAKGK